MRWESGITVPKDPDAVKDWYWDWSDWLTDGDSVASFIATPETGLEVDSSVQDANGVRVVLSGGTDGDLLDVTVEITTVAGFKDHRTVTFEVGEQ